MPTFDPSDLIGRTFLLPPEENGERHRAKVTRQVVEIIDQDNGQRVENINFILDIGNGKVEELISYNQLLEHLENAQDHDMGMADRERDMIPLESDQYKNDPVINQHIMQMIDTNIFGMEAILMELWKIRNGETIAQSGEELSKEEIHYCDESHTMFNDQRLYIGEKTQQDHEVMESIRDESKTQKDWPRKCFQMDENETYESAMMCWESLDNSKQASKKRKNELSRCRNKQ